jgi:pilus assembly protein CpaF
MLKKFLRSSQSPRAEVDVIQDSSWDAKLQALQGFLEDEQIDEIWLGPAGSNFARNRDRSMKSIHLLWSSDDLSEFMIDLAERVRVRLDPLHPYGGGIFPGYPWRWHASIPPLSPDGPRVSLRRQRFEYLDHSSFKCENFSIEELSQTIRSGKTILFFGATGSGKTSLLVRVLMDFFHDSRVGIAETVVEIPLMSPYWFRLTEVPQDAGHRGGIVFGRVVAELMRATPDFIVLGEIRGAEAAYLGDLARSGHGGVLSTMHAGSFDDALARLASMAGAASNDLPPIVGVHVWRSSAGTVHASRVGSTLS